MPGACVKIVYMHNKLTCPHMYTHSDTHPQHTRTIPTGTQLVELLLTAATKGWKGPQRLQQTQSTVRQDADKIGVEGARKLGLFLARCLHLRHLALSGHSIRDEGALVLVPALAGKNSQKHSL